MKLLYVLIIVQVTALSAMQKPIYQSNFDSEIQEIRKLTSKGNRKFALTEKDKKFIANYPQDLNEAYKKLCRERRELLLKGEYLKHNELLAQIERIALSNNAGICKELRAIENEIKILEPIDAMFVPSIMDNIFKALTQDLDSANKQFKIIQRHPFFVAMLLALDDERIANYCCNLIANPAKRRYFRERIGDTYMHVSFFTLAAYFGLPKLVTKLVKKYPQLPEDALQEAYNIATKEGRTTFFTDALLGVSSPMCKALDPGKEQEEKHKNFDEIEQLLAQELRKCKQLKYALNKALRTRRLLDATCIFYT